MQKRILDMPVGERPYEKCYQYGPEVLTDAELLAVIIRTGSKGERSLDLAREVLQSSRFCNGILGIYHSSFEELMQIKGIGKVKAIQLKCVAELAKRFSKAKMEESLSFQKPDSIAGYYMEMLRHEEREKLLLVMLNTKCKRIREVIISTGTVNASIVSPREVFLEALRNNAVFIILIHNHPSGDAAPSREDVFLTERIRRCGELIGIELMDHIIIGDNQYVSFKEKGMIK